MEDQYKTLHTIYDIVKDDAQPETYKCRPREIILRQYQSWSTIQKHLKILEEEGMIILKHEDTLVICITSMGMEKIKAERRFQF